MFGGFKMAARKLSVAFIIFTLTASIFAADKIDVVGKAAPDITIRQWVTPNPPQIKTLKGSVSVIEFWATWCAPCVENIPHLIKLNNKYKSKGLQFIGLSQDKSVDKVKKLIDKKGINYNIAIDNGTADWFGVRGYPTVYIVNHLGKVTWKGYPWDKNFEKEIQKALKAAPPKKQLVVAKAK